MTGDAMEISVILVITWIYTVNNNNNNNDNNDDGNNSSNDNNNNNNNYVLTIANMVVLIISKASMTSEQMHWALSPIIKVKYSANIVKTLQWIFSQECTYMY